MAVGGRHGRLGGKAAERGWRGGGDVTGSARRRPGRTEPSGAERGRAGPNGAEKSRAEPSAAGAMQAFLKGPSAISTKPPAARDRGAAGSSGEGKKPRPVPWVEK